MTKYVQSSFNPSFPRRREPIATMDPRRYGADDQINTLIPALAEIQSKALRP